MKRIILLFTIIYLLSAPVRAFAGAVTIVDKEDVKVELTSVETKEINLQSGEVQFTIPIAKISTIHLAEDGKTLILRSITGKELKGTSISKLECTWDLGKYSIALSSIKSVDFGRDVKSQQATTTAIQPEGFFAACTDRTGMTFEVFSFCYNFTYGGGMGTAHIKTTPACFFPSNIGSLLWGFLLRILI